LVLAFLKINKRWHLQVIFVALKTASVTIGNILELPAAIVTEQKVKHT
jgi:hypothetical protein